MFFKLKSNVIFRDYVSFGYLTDNRNYGYKLTDNNENYIGDKILSESGAVFLSALERIPKTLDDIVIKIKKQFPKVDSTIINNDASELFSMLEGEGFIVSGKTFRECEEKDIRFSYKTLAPEVTKMDNYSIINNPEKSTQIFIEEFFENKPQLTNLHLEITSKCNERCIHCYIPHDFKVSFMEPDLFYEVIEQCKSMKLLHLTLSGGEPMLHKNFCDFLRKCKESDFSVNVLSNLTLLNEEIIKEMKSNPLLGVQVSLYSMDANIHDEITQMKGSFEKTKNSILKLIGNDIPIQISCPIMKQNKNCFNDVKKWANSHKVHVGDDYVIIARYNNTKQNLKCRLSINEINDVINYKVANDEKYLEQVELAADKNRDRISDDYVCSVCHSSICIADNGNVYPCAGWQGCVVGNVKETLLSEIWDNSEKVQYLRGLRKKDFPECIQCPDKEYCTMCMVRNANENPQGNPLVLSKYFCDIAKLNRKLILEWKETLISS